MIPVKLYRRVNVAERGLTIDQCPGRILLCIGGLARQNQFVPLALRDSGRRAGYKCSGFLHLLPVRPAGWFIACVTALSGLWWRKGGVGENQWCANSHRPPTDDPGI